MTTRISKPAGAAAVAIALAFLLVLAGQALGTHDDPNHAHGPAMSPNPPLTGKTTDRIFINTRPNTTSVVRTFQLDFEGAHATPWHTHPGPGVVTVVSGDFQLERVTKRGCIEKTTYGAGDAFVDGGASVHRLVPLGGEGVVSATFITEDVPLTTVVDPPDAAPCAAE